MNQKTTIKLIIINDSKCIMATLTYLTLSKMRIWNYTLRNYKYILALKRGMLWLRWLDAGLSPCKMGLIMADIIKLKQGFYPSSSAFPANHHELYDSPNHAAHFHALCPQFVVLSLTPAGLTEKVILLCNLKNKLCLWKCYHTLSRKGMLFCFKFVFSLNHILLMSWSFHVKLVTYKNHKFILNEK